MSRTHSSAPWGVVPLACLAVTACTDLPTEAVQPNGVGPAVLYANGGKGGKPNAGSSDIPAMFDQFSGAISSDRGSEGFADGLDFVKADIESDGRAWLQTFAGNVREGEDIVRGLCVDLSTFAPDGEPEVEGEHWTAFQEAAQPYWVEGVEDKLCVSATLHTRNHSNGGDKMLDMAVGKTAHAGGKIALTELASSSRNSWEWRLIFDTYPMDPAAAHGVCIERLADITRPPDTTPKRSWRLSNGCTAAGGSVDDTVELWRFIGKGDPVHVADFTMLFALVVTEL